MVISYNEGVKNRKNYIEFGKFILQQKFLLDNYIYLRYKSYAPSKIKKTKISDELKELFLFIIDTQKIDYDLIKILPQEEIELFNKIMDLSGLTVTFKYNKSKSIMNEKEIMDRFTLIQAQLDANNNNDKLIKEARVIIKQLYNLNKVSKNDYDELMEELNLY
jgi:hypothetical protein